MAERAPSRIRRKPGRNEFGHHLYGLMASKDVRSATELAQILENQGYGRITRQTINDYAAGRAYAPPRFVEKLVEVFGLEREEYVALAVAHSYGQQRS